MLNKVLKKLFWGIFRHVLIDQQYTQFRYWLEFGRLPDLKNPERFTEKIQYIKLHERTGLRQVAANRIEVREYITEKIGEDHLIPLLGNFENLTLQAWNSLPRSFVLKANHGCKMVEIIEEKSAKDYDDILQVATAWQNTDYYKFGREWVYKDVPRTIVAEELLQNNEGDIPDDYKFFCFNGRVECIQVDFGRFENHTRNFYSRDFNLLPVTLIHDQNDKPVEKHPLLEQGIQLAETVAEDFSFIRVDLFLLDDSIYFGELTNFPNNGFSAFNPDYFDIELGKKLKL